MNPTLNNLGTLLSNPHFRYPAIAVLACEVGKIWLPQFKDQFDATQKPFMLYMMAAAGNATPTPPKGQ